MFSKRAELSRVNSRQKTNFPNDPGCFKGFHFVKFFHQSPFSSAFLINLVWTIGEGASESIRRKLKDRSARSLRISLNNVVIRRLAYHAAQKKMGSCPQ